jgi:hypothetical protein
MVAEFYCQCLCIMYVPLIEPGTNPFKVTDSDEEPMIRF